MLFDMGKPVARRYHQDGLDLGPGMGGAGTFSDDKIAFQPQVGGDRYGYTAPDQTWDLVDYIEHAFGSCGVNGMITDGSATRDLEKSAAKAGVRFLPIRQAHIGYDHLTELVQGLGHGVQGMDVAFGMQTRVVAASTSSGHARGAVPGDGHVVRANAVLPLRTSGGDAGEHQRPPGIPRWLVPGAAKHAGRRWDARLVRAVRLGRAGRALPRPRALENLA